MSDTPNEAPQEAPASAEASIGGGAGDFRLRGAAPRVTRLSRKALAVVGVAAGLGIGGSLIYALQPRGPAAPAQNLYGSDHGAKADVVTAAPADYSKVPKLGQPLPGDLGRPILSAQANGQAVPVPPMGAPAGQPDPRVAAAEQARQRVAQERDSARTSSLFLGGANAGASGGAATPQPSAGPQTAAMPGDVAAPATTPASGQSANRAFLQVAANRTTASSERITAPVSPYVVQAGSIIPAALITGIRSDLPGQITAQVTQNVYDSPTGKILLIPQGSRLIGEYDSDVSAGQNRVLLAWDRLILPGGRSILLDRQPGADAAGMAGLQDRTNYHWGNMLKAALVSTLLGVGTEFATDGDDRLTRALRYGTQNTINQSGQQLVQREINVPPTLTIRPGFPLRVIVTRDLVLEAEGGQP
ncbi:TrbI/VirB10 family protein [Sphingomonas oryzagri]